MTKKTFIIGEIGINASGQIDTALELIKQAKECGADAVKFQKRTVDKVYTPQFLLEERNDGNPYGWKTQGDQKRGIEFSEQNYNEIDVFCKKIGILWGASSWDCESQLFLRQYDLSFNKIASPMLTNIDLLKLVAEEGKYTFISTGISTFEEIQTAIDIFEEYRCPYELMHCNSAYPSLNKDANLYLLDVLRMKFNCKIGYSSHEDGRVIALAAVARGATSIEKHITLSKNSYGSDQKASLEMSEFRKMIVDIREIEPALNINVTKNFPEAELAVRKKLRGN